VPPNFITRKDMTTRVSAPGPMLAARYGLATPQEDPYVGLTRVLLATRPPGCNRCNPALAGRCGKRGGAGVETALSWAYKAFPENRAHVSLSGMALITNRAPHFFRGSSAGFTKVTPAGPTPWS
jgi:hypothetical protein